MKKKKYHGLPLQCHYLCCILYSCFRFEAIWFCYSVLTLEQNSKTSPKRFKTTPKFVTFKLLIYANVPKCILVALQVSTCWGLIPRGGTPYNGLYGEAPPEMGTFLRLQVRDMKGQGFHLLKYMKGQGDRSFRSVKSGSRRANRCILWL